MENKSITEAKAALDWAKSNLESKQHITEARGRSTTKLDKARELYEKARLIYDTVCTEFIETNG